MPYCTYSRILFVAPSTSFSVFLSHFLARVLFVTPVSLSSCFQPYNQKEPPVVRVVEGPLFSEVVAHYQHFQQTIRIHNVPGNKRTKLHNLISSNGFCKSFSCLVKGTRWYNTARPNMFENDKILQNAICKVALDPAFVDHVFPFTSLCEFGRLRFCIFRGGWVVYRHHYHGGHQRSDQ